MHRKKGSEFVFCITMLASLVFFLLFTNIGCETVSLPAYQSYFVPEDSLDSYSKVAFLAYERGTEIKGKKSIAGHASVVIDDTEIWGFYPSIEGRFFTARGLLKKNSEHPEVHEYVDFTVDRSLMDEIRTLIRQWEEDPPAFIIPLQDCVHFVYRICDIIGLRYNRFALIPTTAVKSIRQLNDSNQVYRSRHVPRPAKYSTR
jgi:hypothetical protein